MVLRASFDVFLAASLGEVLMSPLGVLLKASLGAISLEGIIVCG